MWARIAGIALGLLLMGGPTLLGYGGPMADVQHVVGPLVVAASTIAISPTTTAFRWLDLPLGLIVAGSAALGPAAASGQWLAVLAGGGVALLAFVPSPPHGRIGGGWRALFATDEPAGASAAEPGPSPQATPREPAQSDEASVFH